MLQHIGCEPAGAFADELLRRDLGLQEVHLDDGDELPDWRGYSGILAMGGPMGTYDEELYPWLAEEKLFIAEAVRAGKPFWGICLGAQLLAASLGAAVLRGPLPEVGVLAVELTREAAGDRVFARAPASFPALHWHGDTYELPRGAVQLARSEQYEQQAFAFANAYGLQFHLEVTAALVAQWGTVPAYADSLQQLARSDPMGPLLAQIDAAESASIALARELFGAWLERVVGIPATPLTRQPPAD